MPLSRTQAPDVPSHHTTHTTLIASPKRPTHRPFLRIGHSCRSALPWLIPAGTRRVAVTAISFAQPPAPPAEPVIAEKTAAGPAETIFVQVGAFGEPENARRRFNQLRDLGLDRAFVYEDRSTSPALYRVRIGPIGDVVQYDSIVERLQNVGISDTHLVTE